MAALCEQSGRAFLQQGRHDG
ncbi:hypothetical protein Q9966_001911 [Columba livia]|nr:hypothetical protein Q9233_000984 [Columba guinea]KAK2544497.1 hypothetical protein Q9966_001911 [Columba livia]